MRETFPMLRPGGVREDILRMTFGDCTRQREHPLARFCAALAEAVGTDYLIAAEEGDGYVEPSGVTATAQTPFPMSAGSWDCVFPKNWDACKAI